MNIDWITQTITTIGIGILAYLIKDMKKNIDKDINQNKSEIAEVERNLNDKIEKVEKKVDDFKDHVNKNFVDKESYIRNITNFDCKLDKITDLIMEMKGERRRE